jgi:hypothetical protein
VVTLSAQGGFCPPPPNPGFVSPTGGEVIDTLTPAIMWRSMVEFYYSATLYDGAVVLATRPFGPGSGLPVGPLQPEHEYRWTVTTMAYQGCEMNPSFSFPQESTFKTPQRIETLTGNLAFGNVEVNTTTTRTFTIDVTGWSPSLTVSDITYPPGFSGDWAGGTIASGSSQTVTVTFAPAAVTSYGGTITINGNHTGGTNTIAVSGMGAPAPPMQVLWRNAATGENMGWQLNGTTVVHSPTLPAMDTNWEVGGSSDFDANGTIDFLWRNRATGENLVWLMAAGAVSQSVSLPAIADANWEFKGAADLNGDAKADVILRHKTLGLIVALLIDGTTFTAGGLLLTIADLNWEISGLADLDGDTKADLVLRNKATGQIAALLLNGASIKSGGLVVTIPDLNWQIDGIGDLDRDGNADLILRNKATGQFVALGMTGAAISSGALLATVADTNWEIKATTDLNADGSADLVVRHRVTGQNVGWLMNGLMIEWSAFLDTIADTNWDIVGP